MTDAIRYRLAFWLMFVAAGILAATAAYEHNRARVLQDSITYYNVETIREHEDFLRYMNRMLARDVEEPGR